ncbi:glutamate racemase [Lactobacillus corticis]|uniref:Glutamate racemase n=1 Tax=Lactobacillus corticis TaxID=2201249 RepID=A0A916VI35_9LACO|nr:glutamate racemase [Lactobacillus corticis]GFZ27332.1 glutamate racemase [Lactobacillus corticis]
MDNRPIGLLDSGVGGLSVVKKVIAKLPQESTIFIGDNAHMPYGDRSDEEIIKLTKKSVQFLLQQDIKLLIIACNTATAVAMATVQAEIAPQVIGVIQSGGLAAARSSRNKKVAVVGTSATVASKNYTKEITFRDPAIQVEELATPKLAPLVEAQKSPSENDQIVKASLAPLIGKDFDTLVLGCTHYPLIRSSFQKAVGPDVKIIDPADQVAEYTSKVLARDGLLSETPATHRYYTTGDVEHFEKLARPFLGQADLTAEHVETDD